MPNAVVAHVARNKTGYAGLTVAVLSLAAAFIAPWEGEDHTAKHNSFDPKGVITVCNGVTNYDWPWLKPGMKFTHEQCQKALMDLIPKYDAEIKKCLSPAAYAALPPHRHVALISFDYNVGAGNFCRSSVARDLNGGRVKQACDALLSYTRAAGKVLKGLVSRRQSERKLCLMED